MASSSIASDRPRRPTASAASERTSRSAPAKPLNDGTRRFGASVPAECADACRSHLGGRIAREFLEECDETVVRYSGKGLDRRGAEERCSGAVRYEGSKFIGSSFAKRPEELDQTPRTLAPHADPVEKSANRRRGSQADKRKRRGNTHLARRIVESGCEAPDGLPPRKGRQHLGTVDAFRLVSLAQPPAHIDAEIRIAKGPLDARFVLAAQQTGELETRIRDDAGRRFGENALQGGLVIIFGEPNQRGKEPLAGECITALTPVADIAKGGEHKRHRKSDAAEQKRGDPDELEHDQKRVVNPIPTVLRSNATRSSRARLKRSVRLSSTRHVRPPKSVFVSVRTPCEISGASA